MDINQLIELVKKKIEAAIIIEDIKIEDKTFLHEGHLSNQKGKFHIKLIIKSSDLKKKNKIDSTKLIYKVLDEEIKKYIHSIQIFIE